MRHDLADRPALNAEEIEITPEMIEAGVRALRTSGLLEYPSLANEAQVRALLNKTFSRSGKMLVYSDR